MINSDINPLSRQEKTCLRSACFPNGASRRKNFGTFGVFGQFISLIFFFFFEENVFFSVWRGGACQSFATFVTLDKHCSTSRLFNPKVDVGHFRGLLPQRLFRGICLPAALFSKWPSKSVCKLVLRSFFFWCSSTDMSGVVFDTRSKMVMWQGGTTERMKEKVRRLTWRAPVCS